MRGTLTVHGRRVAYESGLERDLLHLLSLDRTVEEIAGQPLTLRFADPATGAERRYTPDLLVRHGGPRPRTCLIEVKYREDLWHQFWREGLKAKMLAARGLCREQGWTFLIRTEAEIRGPGLANAAFLRAYLDSPTDAAVEGPLAAALAAAGRTTPQALLATAFPRAEDRAHAVPHLWRMVAQGRISADLALPLTMASPISSTLGEG